MKRSSDRDKSADGPSSSGRNQAKRPKSSQACSSCRKLKTRCELLDGPSEGPYRCHRCKVLNISCSFESSDFAPPLQHHSPSPTQTSARISPPNISGDGAASGSENSVKMEDFLPRLPPKPWGFVKVPGGFDWRATPMLALQNATTSRLQLDEDQSVSDVNVVLANILSPDRVESLLDIFESVYNPWLNLPPNQGGTSPILTLARCMVASRHLDTNTRASVVPQLQQLTERVIFRHLFNPIPSTQSIQAILILSLWSPVAGRAQAEVRDGRLLIASGVSMAMNQRLSQAAEYVAGLRDEMKNQKNASGTITSDLDDAMDKVRLWLCLMNAESMLCIGTGRTPLSHRTALDLAVIDFTTNSKPNTTVGSGRDMRLALMGQIFEVAEEGLRITLSSKSEFDRFYKDVLDVLSKLDNLFMHLSPLPVVVEHERFYFHVLRIYHHTCRLLFIHHCLYVIRRVVLRETTSRPWYMFEYNGVNIAKYWGQEAKILAEDILCSTISRPELKQLGAAPDNVFAMICFAASFLVMCKISVYQSDGEHLLGSSDYLLAKVTDRLLQVACSLDHAPAKCAQLISELVASYEARMTKGDGECEQLGPQNLLQNTSSEKTSAVRREPEIPGFSADGQPHFDASLPAQGSGVDLNRFMNSGVMLDSEFWASFMGNLATDAPHVEGVRNS